MEEGKRLVEISADKASSPSSKAPIATQLAAAHKNALTYLHGSRNGYYS